MLHPIIEFDHNTQKQPKLSLSHQNPNLFDSENIILRAGNSDVDHGDSSPPLWKTKSQNVQGDFHSLSPNSRTKAIARGQKEMMDMVKNMPESCYELSLKDIVDHRRFEGEKAEEKQKKDVIKRSESGGKMMRSRSNDYNAGLLLKIGFPVSIMGKKKKESEKVTKSKVFLKPESYDKSSKNSEKYWWKKRTFSDSGSSDGSRRRAFHQEVVKNVGSGEYTSMLETYKGKSTISCTNIL